MFIRLNPTYRRRGCLFVVLVTLLASVYMLTYSGRIESGDTLFLVDAIGSLVNEGDMRLDLAVGQRPPLPQLIRAGEQYPLPDAGAEALQLALATPLYWAAQRLPGVGLIHALYLFNVIVCALAGGVMFLYGVALGYSERAAMLGGLALGLGTALWPYSKSFFQEPLALLLLLTAALLLERWRAGHFHSIGLLIAGALAITGAALAKNAAVLALPALLVIALPEVRAGAQRVRLLRYAVFALVTLALLIAAGEIFGVFDRLERLFVALQGPQIYTGPALQSYLLSLGGSIWGTSPVLLLALPGIWLLVRRRRWRYPTALALALGAFALVYAIRQGPDWFGGLSWPPRFLIPVIPFALLCALPAIERLTTGPISRWLRVMAGLLALYSLWVQISGVSLWWGDYPSALPPEAGGLIEWGGGLYDVRYLRWVVIPALWGTIPFDFAWVRTGAPGWPAAFAVVTAASAALMVDLLRARPLRRWPLVAGLPILLLICVWGGLRAIYIDTLYLGDRDSLHAMLPLIADAGEPGDVVLLSDPEYVPFFLNYAHFSAPRLVSLPYQPGEQPSPEQPPLIDVDNPDFLVEQNTGPLIHALAETRSRLWLLSSGGPFLPWKVRPVERFMAMHYHPGEVQETAPDVRLIAYSAADAPDPYAFRGPEYLCDVTFGGVMTLVGYDLAAGRLFVPGDMLPVSLYWQAAGPVEEDYTVAWFLRDRTGWEVQQGMDSEPGASFMPTSRWVAGVPVRDNRALRIPENLEPGAYRLWVVVYGRDADGAAVNLPAEGADTSEGYIGVLPVTIEIQ